jgi:putative FmdB family regulatory protein
MPLHDFKCEKCGHEEELLVKTDEKNPNCPKCDEEMHKLMSSGSFILRGKGWASDSYGLKDKGK